MYSIYSTYSYIQYSTYMYILLGSVVYLWYEFSKSINDNSFTSNFLCVKLIKISNIP